MPIRIYALAKELQIDNKKLVDICTRAGITGKGSALASLTDEEVVRLKAFMAGGRGGKAEAAAPARSADAGAGRSIRRDDYIGPAGTGTKVPVMPVRQDRPPLLRKKPEETPAPAHPAIDVPPAAREPAVPIVPAVVPPAPVVPVACRPVVCRGIAGPCRRLRLPRRQAPQVHRRRGGGDGAFCQIPGGRRTTGACLPRRLPSDRFRPRCRSGRRCRRCRGRWKG